MPFLQPEILRYFQFESFCVKKATPVHGIFTRHGGVSPEPWAKLNVGGTVGDDRNRVKANQNLIFREMKQDVSCIFDVWQVHGSTVVYTKSPRKPDATYQQADAILTDQSGIILFMRFADCVPILLWDPNQSVVGLVHAGWQGTVKSILGDTITIMKDQFHSKPGDIIAGIGPSICPSHYAVGFKVIEQIRESFGQDATYLLTDENQEQRTMNLNLWEANRLILERAGVKNIEISGICTVCNLHDWYSHRGENGKTGRFGALIGLNG
jgi:YfiH family protein